MWRIVAALALMLSMVGPVGLVEASHKERPVPCEKQVPSTCEPRETEQDDGGSDETPSVPNEKAH